ncbi:MAG: hypothetical protein IH957_06770 [Chloroflexi bacterium]|nr:hypothetical protein [Chloroflexota bacterium]
MAKRNGGPKTARGKSRSSKNAIKHGLTSQSPVLPHVESEDEWQSFRHGILTSFELDTPLETELAERIALLLWLLRRVARYHRQKTISFRDRIPQHVVTAARYGAGALGLPEPSHEELVERAEALHVQLLFPEDEILAHIVRYEAHLHRQYIQTMHELEAFQLRRTGGHSPLARLDISAPPAG